MVQIFARTANSSTPLVFRNGGDAEVLSLSSRTTISCSSAVGLSRRTSYPDENGYVLACWWGHANSSG